MLSIQNISYIHPNKDLLFSGIDLTVNKYEKAALIGNNGSGKTTLLKIIAGEIRPNIGNTAIGSVPYYIPQIFGQYNHLSIAQVLGISEKLRAQREILGGNVSEESLVVLNDDWTLEERCQLALNAWGLDNFELSEKMESLSGGEKTKVFLAGIQIHEPEFILMDEPSNHLDLDGRERLYDFIRSTKSTLLMVSHDRKLLNLADKVCEMHKSGILVYGGNYDFYKTQKQIQTEALYHDIQSKEGALRKAREKERETIERKQKLNSRGKQKQEKAGVARIMMNTLRNNAEKSTSKLQNVHGEKTENLSGELQNLRNSLPEIDKMKFGFNNSTLYKGKILLRVTDLNFCYGSHGETNSLWQKNLNFEIVSGERIAFKSANGSGKTTLINLLLGNIKPTRGNVYKSECESVFIDQDYSLINNNISLYELAQRFNTSALLESEIKTRLKRFLFTKEDWNKPCSALSGGERIRLILCCLTIKSQSPDILIFDEPTNNLDLQNIEILAAALNDYQGTLLIVSHDESFLEQIKIKRTITL